MLANWLKSEENEKASVGKYYTYTKNSFRMNIKVLISKIPVIGT